MDGQQVQIDGRTRILGVFGHPVSHSLSPVMHNALFAHLGIDAVYVPLSVESGNIGEAIAGFRTMGFLGANVTIPFKETVLPYLDSLSPLSRFMGSVNTLYWEGHKLCGTTTDSWGALRNLEDAGISLHGLRVGLLGSGGAARALAFALLFGNAPEGAPPAPEIAHLTLLGRNVDKLGALQFDLERAGLGRGMLDSVALDDFPRVTGDVDLVINATSVGMHPGDGESPIDAKWLHREQAVYDIVYSPRRTRLLREAEAMGCRTVEGLGMLVHQGALSFERWFQRQADTGVMRSAIEEYLSRRQMP